MESGRGELLVVRNDRLGDAILSLPAILLLRRRYPDARIHFWASPSVAPLIECVDGIDQVIPGSDRGASAAGAMLRSLPIRTAYCLRPTFHNAWTLKQAGIPVRVGTSRRWYSLLFTHRVNLPRSGTTRHEADLNLDLLSAVGIDGPASFPRIIIPDAALSSVEQLLETAGFEPDQRLVVIHPGSGGSTREWPARYFRELADELTREGSAGVIVTGVVSESGKCAEVAGDEHLNLCNRLNLLELAALLSKSNLVVANSTGPLHLAVALGRRVIGLYPPVKDSRPARWGPYGHPEWALTPDLPLCRRCRHGEFSPCACMEELRPERVAELAFELLER